MNLFKKVIATIALSTMLIANVASVSAYSSDSVDAANTLAGLGIINDHSSDAAAYNLDQNVLRQEIAAVTMGVAGLDKKTSCDNEFADVSMTTPNTWACYVVETLRDADMIAANANFNPESNITKAEALGMLVKAAFGDGYSYDANLSSTWQEQLVAFASENGVVEAFTDYNTPATRGWVFEVAVSSMDAAEMVDGGDDILCELLGTCDDNGGDDNGGDDNGGVVVGGSELMVELSPETPASATIPGNISGLPVAAFDFTAGSEDVTVTALTVKRRGLSDGDTLTALAVFSDEGRASKSKNDSQNNDTEAQLTLSDGGVVVMAGQTLTLTIVADVADTLTANGDEFAIELLDVTATTGVEGLMNLVANTMKVGGVDAAVIDIQADSSVSDVKAGEFDAEIFKFKIEGDNDADVLLKSLTFKGEGSVDEEDDLANFTLLNDGVVLSEVAMSNGKYVTFDLGDGFTVAEDKTEKFVVTADIMAGAGKDVTFKVDKTLDVTAEDDQYGFGAAVTIAAADFGTIDIEPGELTLNDEDAPSDKIREGKTNVELGSIEVNNIAGQNLELQKFGVQAQVTGVDNLEDIFENFEVVINGTSYELEPTNGASQDTTYEDTDLDISLPQGVTTIVLRADTKDTLTPGDEIEFSLATPTVAWDGDGSFYVVETEDDNVVTDLTPSSLSFKKLEVIESAATVANVPLADVTVVRGAEDVVAQQFELEADEASSLTVDEVKVYVDAAGAAATNQEVSEVALYKGSVSAANLLDRVSGSNIGATGIATFDGFNVEVAADAKQTFVVTLNIVDGADAVLNSPITVELYELGLEDDDNDDVVAQNSGADLSPANELASNKDVFVTAEGTLALTEDANNDANTDPKTTLAGESVKVFSVDVQATNEEVEVETVVFDVDTDLRNAVVSASLYLDDELIATNSNSDITAGDITFDNLNGLVIPEETAELVLQLNTATIGYEKVGETILGATVTHVYLSDATGVESGKDVVDNDTAVTGTEFSIAPAVVTPSVVSQLSGGQAKLRLTVDTGDNTVDANNSAPSVLLTDLVFSELGNNVDGYNIYKEGESARKGTISSAGVFAAGAMTAADLTISDEEVYVIVPVGTVDSTYTLNLTKQGVEYTANGILGAAGITNNMTEELELGSKTY